MTQQTLALHAGYEKDSQGTMAVPIYMSTAYEFRDSEHAANLFALKELGNIYTRLTNPTSAIFEKRFAQMEDGVAAIATASGMSAIFSTIVNLCESGDNIIVANAVYGGTSTLTDHTIKRFGIEARAFDINKPKEIEKLIDDNTKQTLTFGLAVARYFMFIISATTILGALLPFFREDKKTFQDLLMQTSVIKIDR